MKFIFGRAAEEYENAAKVLQPMAKGKGSKGSKVPDLFPSEDYKKVECYVCGYEADADEIPESCPSCDAARYAFEKDVSQERAWELVARTTKSVIAFTRKAGTSVKDAKAKEAVAKAVGIHKGLLAEAQEERARFEGEAP